MSQATDQLYYAFELLETALAEIAAAQLAIPDEEFTLDLPSVLVCSYEPLQERSRFTLLGTVHHAAQALEEGLADPVNTPFRKAVIRAMVGRLASLGH